LNDIWCEDEDWLYLAEDRDHWQALVHTIMNLRVPNEAKEFLDRESDYSGFSRGSKFRVGSSISYLNNKAFVCVETSHGSQT
jgi:hypothetical protein